MKTRSRGVLTGVLLAGWLVGWGAASAAVYRWTDEAGRVHFGQVPPADRPYTVVKVPGDGRVGFPAREEARREGAAGAAPSRPSAAEGAGGQGVAEVREAPGEGAGGQSPRAAARPSPAACARLARALETLISRPPSRVLVRGPGGEPRRMSEAEHHEQVARLRRRLAHCPGR